jgi:hypothetical protein
MVVTFVVTRIPTVIAGTVLTLFVDAALIRFALFVGVGGTVLISCLIVGLCAVGLLLHVRSGGRDRAGSVSRRLVFIHAVLSGLLDTASRRRLVGNGRTCADSGCERQCGEHHTKSSVRHRVTSL